MPIRNRHILLAAAGLCAAALCCEAGAADYSNAASYNSAYGMTAGQENQAVNPSLRDANGNLSIVNGQFTSSSFSRQTGVQTMGTIGSSTLSSLGTSSGAGTTYGTATAIGNSLNVVTVGNNNTVIVNSTQTNTGNITATTSLNGSSK